MICPYQRPHINEAFEKTYEYDTEGRVIKETYANQSNSLPLRCMEDKCGAWKDGECGYYFTDTTHLIGQEGGDAVMEGD